jgi:hypothetical protein
MRANSLSLGLALTPMLLQLLLAACASALPPFSPAPVAVKAQAIPPLRQSGAGLCSFASKMGRFEMRWLAAPENLSAIADLSG